jgi:hypothetical protein
MAGPASRTRRTERNRIAPSPAPGVSPRDPDRPAGRRSRRRDCAQRLRNPSPHSGQRCCLDRDRSTGACRVVPAATLSPYCGSKLATSPRSASADRFHNATCHRGCWVAVVALRVAAAGGWLCHNSAGALTKRLTVRQVGGGVCLGIWWRHCKGRAWRALSAVPRGWDPARRRSRPLRAVWPLEVGGRWVLEASCLGGETPSTSGAAPGLVHCA